MITKKAGDLLLKIGFSLRVGNGRSRESSVCEDNIIEKTHVQHIYNGRKNSHMNGIIYSDIKYQPIKICRMSLYKYTFGIIVKACEFNCVPFPEAE